MMRQQLDLGELTGYIIFGCANISSDEIECTHRYLRIGPRYCGWQQFLETHGDG